MVDGLCLRALLASSSSLPPPPPDDADADADAIRSCCVGFVGFVGCRAGARSSRAVEGTIADRAVGGVRVQVKEEQPVGDTAARSAVNVAATARADLFVMVALKSAENERLSVLPTVGTYNYNVRTTTVPGPGIPLHSIR